MIKRDNSVSKFWGSKYGVLVKINFLTTGVMIVV